MRLFKDVRFFLNTLNRAVGVMVDAGIGATVKQQESDDGLTLTICIPHAKGYYISAIRRDGTFVSCETKAWNK